MTKKEKKELDRNNDEYASLRDLRGNRGLRAIGFLLVVLALLMGIVFSR